MVQRSPGFLIAAVLLAATVGFSRVAYADDEVQVSRMRGSTFMLHWTLGGPVDVFVSAHPDARLASMRELVKADRDARFEAQIPDIRRPYFALRTADGRVYRAGERLLPLAGGSNFRDLGGYPAAGGRRVRWGLLYRSAATQRLTGADVDYLSTLQIKALVDLRSVDERQLLPTEWRARPRARYVVVDYPGTAIFGRLSGYDGPDRRLVNERLYAVLPMLLRREYKAVFDAILQREVPLLIQGGAGQDRTGVAVGLLLSALGTPRERIYDDYLLSAQDRTAANETFDADLDKYAATNAEARFLLAYRAYGEKMGPSRSAAMDSKPLMDSKGRPLLQDAFEQIEADYGSIPAYLESELGIGPAQIARLRALCLE